MADKLLVDQHIEEVCDELKRYTYRDAGRTFSNRADQFAEFINADLLTWSQHFLPRHFRLPASKMHRWLAERLDARQWSVDSGQWSEADKGSPSRSDNALLTPDHRPLTTARGVKLNVVGPRGSAKSTVVTLAYVLREALSGREPYIWIVSDTKHQAAAHLENVKTELMENRRLLQAYPQAAGVGPVWRSGAIVLRNGVMIEAFGTGQRIRGRRRKQHRPTLIVCDDLQNDGHIQSALAREHSHAWFHGLLMKAGTKRTNIVNLGTALHRECLAMQLHRTPGWISRVFKAIERWPDCMPLWAAWEEMYQTSVVSGQLSVAAENKQRTTDNEQLAAREFYVANRADMDSGAIVLWPEEEDLYTLMCMRAESGSTAFEREKQSTPVNPELCEWPESYFGDWIWFDEWPVASGPWSVVSCNGPLTTDNGLLLKVISLDPSKGADSRRGDYSAFVMLGVAGDGVLYLEADLARRPTPQIVSDSIEWCRRFRPEVFGIESNQFQELLGAEFAQQLVREGMIGITPCSIENRTNKAVRIRRLGPLLAARRLRFKTNSPGTRMLVEQLKEFPISSHDDGPDAAEMALRLAEARLQPVVDDGLGNRLI